jgi:CRISPR/Cas system-associated endonuclease Cas3-HD
MVKKISQLSKYIPYVAILILALCLWFKGCNDKPQKFTNSELIKNNIKKLTVKKDSVKVEANKTDSIRTKIVIKWRAAKHDTVYKECKELIVICDSIISVDSTQISQLRHVITLSDSIIDNQKIIIHNDSIDKIAITKWGKKQRRQKNLAILGLGVLGGMFLVK